MKTYTVTVAGQETADGAEPYVYVLRALNPTAAADYALRSHIEDQGDATARVIASSEGVPPEGADVEWNDLREALPAADIKIRFARRSQPKRWTDDVGYAHTSWGDAVVTCSEHGEVGRYLTTSYLEETYPEANDTARLAMERHEREGHAPALVQPDVRVTNAPGYADFDGVLLLEPSEDWPVNVVIVGFEWEGKREVAVVPRHCVTRLDDTD
ncbi:hypothetical protein ACIOHE_26465 [Streptomyces sp. NPDC087851]|uniref:hypothetical protein n=1 Tax=Streptomyces sp. NPDC087851 TaxID=3365810 RepID=UPI003807FB10